MSVIHLLYNNWTWVFILFAVYISHTRLSSGERGQINQFSFFFVNPTIFQFYHFQLKLFFLLPIIFCYFFFCFSMSIFIALIKFCTPGKIYQLIIYFTHRHTYIQRNTHLCTCIIQISIRILHELNRTIKCCVYSLKYHLIIS